MISGGSSTDGYTTPTRGAPSPTGSAQQNVSTSGLPHINSMQDSFDEYNTEHEGTNREEFDPQQWEAESVDEDETDDLSGIEYADLSTAGTSGSKKSGKRRIVGSTIGAIGKVATASAKVAKAGAKGSVKAGVAVTKAGVGVTKAGAATGKKVVVSSVKTSVKIGKGTVSAGVSAGKAIIGSTSRSKNPPAKEPKTKYVHSSTKLRRERDLHVAVNKTV
jgi:hypothetical protein